MNDKPKHIPDEAWNSFEIYESFSLSIAEFTKTPISEEETTKLNKLREILFGKDSNKLWDEVPEEVLPGDVIHAILNAYAPHDSIKKKIDNENKLRMETINQALRFLNGIKRLTSETKNNYDLGKFLEETQLNIHVESFIQKLESSGSSRLTFPEYNFNYNGYNSGEEFAYSSRESKSNPDITFIRVLAWNLGCIGFKRGANFYEVIGFLTDSLYPIETEESPTDMKKVENALNLHSRRKK